MRAQQRLLTKPDTLANAILRHNVGSVHVALARTHLALVVGIIARTVALPGLAVLHAVPPRAGTVSASEFSCEHKEKRARLSIWV